MLESRLTVGLETILAADFLVALAFFSISLDIVGCIFSASSNTLKGAFYIRQMRVNE